MSQCHVPGGKTAQGQPLLLAVVGPPHLPAGGILIALVGGAPFPDGWHAQGGLLTSGAACHCPGPATLGPAGSSDPHSLQVTAAPAPRQHGHSSLQNPSGILWSEVATPLRILQGCCRRSVAWTAPPEICSHTPHPPSQAQPPAPTLSLAPTSRLLLTFFPSTLNAHPRDPQGLASGRAWLEPNPKGLLQ